PSTTRCRKTTRPGSSRRSRRLPSEARLAPGLPPPPDIPGSLRPDVKEEVEDRDLVREGRGELRILRISGVALVDELDARLVKGVVADVGPGARAGDVGGGAGLAQEVQEPVELRALGGVHARILERGADPEGLRRDRPRERLVERRQVLPALPEVRLAQ